MGAKRDTTGTSSTSSELDAGYARARAQGGGIVPGAHDIKTYDWGNPMEQIGGVIRKLTQGSRDKAADRAYSKAQYERVDRARAIKGLPALPKPK